MTRRLRMAGVGLCAFLVPACSTITGQTEEAPATPGKGYVTISRPASTMPPGLRQQIAAGQYAGPSESQTASASPLAAEPATSVPNTLPQLPMPTMPGASAPAIVQVKAEQPRGATPSASDPVMAEAAKSVPNPTVVAMPDEPMRIPPWPTLAPTADTARPTQLPDAIPKTEPAPIPPVAPNQSSIALPPATLPLAQESVPAPESSTSLKVTESPAATVAPQPTQAVAETLLVQALRSFQNNRPQEALEHLKHLETANQELLLYLMPLMVRLSEASASTLPPEELAMVIERLQTASSMLKSKATLRADRVGFCRGVRKFADVDPYEAGHEFKPGDMVFLYAELKNFTCEPVAAQKAGYNAPTRGCYIRLGTTLELRDARNNLIWRTDLHKNDYAQVPPQDYYHTYRFCVPDKLTPGNYTLWLNIVDKPTGRAVHQPIEMRVGQN